MRHVEGHDATPGEDDGDRSQRGKQLGDVAQQTLGRGQRVRMIRNGTVLMSGAYVVTLWRIPLSNGLLALFFIAVRALTNDARILMPMKHDPSLRAAPTSSDGQVPRFAWRMPALLIVSLIFGLGWLPFPFDVRMVWTMAAESLLLSLGLAALVLFGVQVRKGLFWPGLMPVLLTLLWLILGAFDLGQAIVCMKASGQW